MTPIGRPGATARPLVTAVIPAFRRPDLLDEALPSVLAQEGIGTVFDLEVVVVYDDAALDLPPGAESRYPGVIFRQHADRGVSAARNAGIRAATGEYVAFLDDDDLWLPHRLRTQVPILEADPDTAVLYGQLRLFGGGAGGEAWPESGPSGRVLEAFVVRTDDFIHPITMLIRREALERVGGFDESIPTMEHYDLSLRLAAHYRFRFVVGPVAVGRFSKEGLWYTTLVNGENERVLPSIVERALGELPDAPRSERVRREARLAVFSTIASHRWTSRGTTGVADYLLESVRRHPWMLREEALQDEMRRLVAGIARRSEDPRSARRQIWRFWVDLREGAKAHGAPEVTRRLAALVWLGLSATSTRHGDHRRACYEALRAVRLQPGLLVRRAEVWKALVRPPLSRLSSRRRRRLPASS